jgi:3-hydroxyisobutyrate dehydrogenase
MVGGDPDAFMRVPVFAPLGRTAELLGPAGGGRHAKMTNRLAIAAGMIRVCESLVYAHGAGLDVAKVTQTIEGGAAGSRSLSNYGPRILRGDFEPGFKIEYFVKDLGIALAEARRMNVVLPGAALAEQLYSAARGQGLSQKGTRSFAVVFTRLSDAGWPSL